MKDHIKAPEVLIVGAGPTGLMMGCQLARHHISFRIIDKKARRTNYSGALIVHARSLEIFDQMGIAQEAIHQGIIAGEIKIIFNGKKAFSIPVNNIGDNLSKFPYMLLLEQSKTEQLLIDFLNNYGYVVEWNTELQNFTQNHDYVIAALKHKNATDTIQVKYLIGADGGHSAIREQSGISFTGSTHNKSLFVSDCKSDVDLKADTICFSFSNEAGAGFFPMTKGRWRIDGTIPKEMQLSGNLNFGDIAAGFGEKTKMKADILDPEWFSVFHSHHYYASSFRQNRCFIAGDAAHIHSPVGAQGMNTGLQDSFNLAWKLALVLQRKASSSLLETYSIERKPIAMKVIRSTSMAYNGVVSPHFLTRWSRLNIFPILLKLFLPTLKNNKFIRHFIFRAISQIGIHYRGSPLSEKITSGKLPSHSPKPGDRLPYLEYSGIGTYGNTFEKIRDTGYQLLLFSKKTSLERISRIADKYLNVINPVKIPYSTETDDLYSRFGITDNGIYLVRPDMYIAYCSVQPDAVHFENYLQRFLFRSRTNSPDRIRHIVSHQK